MVTKRDEDVSGTFTDVADTSDSLYASRISGDIVYSATGTVLVQRSLDGTNYVTVLTKTDADDSDGFEAEAASPVLWRLYFSVDGGDVDYTMRPMPNEQIAKR